MASHVPSPPSALRIYFVFTLCLLSFAITSLDVPLSSTTLTNVGLNSRFAISSATFLLTPPCTCNTFPAFLPYGIYFLFGYPFTSTKTAPKTVIGISFLQFFTKRIQEIYIRHSIMDAYFQ